ncbi:MAG: RNA-binding S4 domain-containing protein [Bacteroidales bacterium]|nr:RNA-binding S4 domain-containing protein [Bacteroidales bacterium]
MKKEFSKRPAKAAGGRKVSSTGGRKSASTGGRRSSSVGGRKASSGKGSSAKMAAKGRAGKGDTEKKAPVRGASAKGFAERKEFIKRSSAKGSARSAAKGTVRAASAKGAPKRGASGRVGNKTLRRSNREIEQLRSQVEERAAMPGHIKSRAQVSTPQRRRPKVSGDEGIRLNKFIANSGICSRREADEYIKQGMVTVNGQIVTELGTKVYMNDDVRFNEQRLKGEEKVYIIMNKPKNCVTTTSDPHATKTVLDLVAGKCPQRVYPVGRLDRDTTGVLLLTNDGELTEKLTHPSYNKKKIYHVFLDSNLRQNDFEKILKGIHLEDGMIAADSLSYIDGDHTQIGIEIHSGRNRIVRRIFESLGYKVKKLDRVYFAGLTKQALRRGQWRFLTDKELAILQMGSYE